MAWLDLRWIAEIKKKMNRQFRIEPRAINIHGLEVSKIKIFISINSFVIKLFKERYRWQTYVFSKDIAHEFSSNFAKEFCQLSSNLINDSYSFARLRLSMFLISATQLIRWDSELENGNGIRRYRAFEYEFFVCFWKKRR